MAKTPCGKALVPFKQKGTSIVGRWADQSAELMACPECGYLVFDPLPTNDELGTYYGSQYWEQGGSFEEARLSYEHGGSYKTTASEIAQLWSDLGIKDQKLRAHEIGCGYGVAVNFMRKLGIEATGSDLSTSAVEIARQLGNPYTEAMPFNEFLASRPNDKINLIYMSHSLEHIPDPAETAREVYNHLDPGGIFFVRVPNGMHLTSRVRSFYEYTWLQYPDHIHYFTPKSSICLLEAAGFEIVKISTLPREEHPGLMLSATLGRAWHDLPDPSAIIRGICDNWLGMELQIIARKPRAGGMAGATKELRAAATKFESNLDLMGLADAVAGDNLELFDANAAAPAWRYFDATDSTNIVPLRPYLDGKRLISDRGLSVLRSVHFVPQETKMRMQYCLPVDPAGEASTQLAKVAISAILPHGEDGEFKLEISINGQIVSRETHASARRHTREIVVKAQAGDRVEFDLTTVKSDWPAIYVHASVRWVELAQPLAAQLGE